MILIDTSVYIATIDDSELEGLLEELSQKAFIQSCDVVEEEIHDSSEFLRKTGRRERAERLRLIYAKIIEGTIGKTERIFNLAQEYQKEAGLSRRQQKDIENDFLIVASAAVAGVKTVLSFNRKTMCSYNMVKVYDSVNGRNRYKTPKFLTRREDLSQLLKLP